jgi:hypothetical protein
MLAYSLVTGNDATGPVFVECTDQMDANKHMNDEDHANPQPDDQTHQASRDAGLGDPEVETLSSNGVKGMICVFSLFSLPYFIWSTSFITLTFLIFL